MPRYSDGTSGKPSGTRLCAGGIVTNPDMEVLVVTNTIGMHTFPKGLIRPGETEYDAALREIYEESGLKKLELGKALGKLTRPGLTALGEDGPHVTKDIEMYHFTTEELILQPVERDIVVARWIDQADLADVLSWPQELDFFMNNREHLGGL